MDYVPPFEVWADGYRQYMTHNLDDAYNWARLIKDDYSEIWIVDSIFNKIQ